MHYAASADVFLSRKGRTYGQSGHSDWFFRETRGRIFVRKKKDCHFQFVDVLRWLHTSFWCLLHFFRWMKRFITPTALVPKWYIKRRNSSKKTLNLFSSRRLITKSQYLGCANVHSKEKEKKKEKETEIIINYSQGEPDNSPIVWTDGSEPLPLAILTNTNSE